LLDLGHHVQAKAGTRSGYLLILVAPTCMWLGLWASEWYEASIWRRSMKLTLIGVCAQQTFLSFSHRRSTAPTDKGDYLK
jgi:hypothetical protein